MISREQAWRVDEADKESKHQARPDRPAAPTPVTPAKTDAASPAPKGGMSHTLANGKKLCDCYQKGKCNNKPGTCPQGFHLCGALRANGKACGGRHPGAECRRAGS
jgi:hypothetical protein